MRSVFGINILFLLCLSNVFDWMSDFKVLILMFDLLIIVLIDLIVILDILVKMVGKVSECVFVREGKYWLIYERWVELLIVYYYY